jgi:hypothetical protein
VPLLPSDEDVRLDLQRAVNACYDLVHYERLLIIPLRHPAAAVTGVGCGVAGGDCQQ